MIEQKGIGALHEVKSASHILLLYSLYWLLAACGAARSVVKPLPATDMEPAARPGSLYVDPVQTLSVIKLFAYGTNYGLWVFLSSAMKPLAVDANLTFLRFPGSE